MDSSSVREGTGNSDNSRNCTDPDKLKRFREAMECRLAGDRIIFKVLPSAEAVACWNETGLNQLVFPPGHGDLLDDPMTGEIIFPLPYTMFEGSLPSWSCADFVAKEALALASGKKATALTVTEALVVYACGLVVPEELHLGRYCSLFAGGTYYGCYSAQANGRKSSKLDVHLYLELFTSQEESGGGKQHFELNIGEIRSLVRQPGVRPPLNTSLLRFTRTVPAVRTTATKKNPSRRKTKKGESRVSATA